MELDLFLRHLERAGQTGGRGRGPTADRHQTDHGVPHRRAIGTVQVHCQLRRRGRGGQRQKTDQHRD